VQLDVAPDEAHQIGAVADGVDDGAEVVDWPLASLGASTGL